MSKLSLITVFTSASLTIVGIAFALNGLSASAASPVKLDRKGERWAASTLHKMTLEEKVGQLIMPWARVQFTNLKSPEYLALKDEMSKYHVGGFGVTVFVDGGNLLKSEPLEAAALTNSLQKDSKYPLLFAADFERGLSVRLLGSTGFPTAMAFGAAGDVDLARQFGKISAEEARAVGVQWNWFPVADVNSNPANPIINTRSFGEDPQQVSDMVVAYIKGAREEGLLTTVKHFPGHGDTDTDSHLTLARSTASVERLNRVELVPFRAAIAAGVDSVMMAHITVPAIEPDPNTPASVSKKVVTGLLKDQLGFRGLVVTDALDMGALMQAFTGTTSQISGKEAVAAIKAGNDMVIIPADLDGSFQGLLAAVKDGTLTEQRIDESVLKILRIKASVGLNRDRFVDISKVTEEVGKPENLELAQTISDRAVTLVSDPHGLLPIKASEARPTGTTANPIGAGESKPSQVTAIIFTDDARNSDGGRAFARQLRQRDPGATVVYVDEANAPFMSADVMAAVEKAGTVVAVVEAVPRARRVTRSGANGSANLDQGAAQLLASVVTAGAGKTMVVAFGSPYVGVGVKGIDSYICTFSNTPSSGLSLARALFGEIPIHGKLPVSIPQIGDRGTGLNLAATAVSVAPSATTAK